MPDLMYQCPSTGIKLQVWYEIDDDPSVSADQYFETVVCAECGQTHLVDTKTGKVVGSGAL